LRVSVFAFQVPGSRFRAGCSVFRVQASGFRVSGSGFRIPGSGFQTSGFGFRVPCFGFRVPGSGSPSSVFWVLEFRVPGTRIPGCRVLFFFFFITLKPRVECYTKSMRLKYEPASEPLHISVK